MDHKCYRLNLFDHTERAASNHRIVSFGEVSVSTFTKMAEDTPNSAVLTDSTPRDNGLNLVSSGSRKAKNDSQRQLKKNLQKTSRKECENCRKLKNDKRKPRRRLTLSPSNFRWSLKESKESTKNR